VTRCGQECDENSEYYCVGHVSQFSAHYNFPKEELQLDRVDRTHEQTIDAAIRMEE